MGTYPGSNVSRLRSKHVEMYPASNARRNVPTLTLVRSARSKTPTEFRPPIQSPPILPESNDSFSSCHTTAHTTLQPPASIILLLRLLLLFSSRLASLLTTATIYFT